MRRCWKALYVPMRVVNWSHVRNLAVIVDSVCSLVQLELNDGHLVAPND